MLSYLKIINPLDIQNWDELILQHSDYSFFHSSFTGRKYRRILITINFSISKLRIDMPPKKRSNS